MGQPSLLSELVPDSTAVANVGDKAVPLTLPGARLVWEALVAEGVDVVFGYPGGAIMPVYDAMLNYPVHHVLVRHEQGAAHMADGYARASGKVGVALATSGPGATNLVTGIATAMLDSVPVVFITGQVSSKLLGSDAFQETDITGVTLPITKHNFLVTRADEIVPTIRQAFAIAKSGRPGPVLVDITKDAQQAEAPLILEREVLPERVNGAKTALCRDPDGEGGVIAQALQMIAAAERPLFLVGHGVVQAGASAALRNLAETIDVPVAATLLGLGAFPASHPLALGMMGMHGQAWVNQAIQEADLIVGLGMRFDDRVTGDPRTFAPRAKKIHVEIDAAEVNKNVRVDLPILGCVGEVLREMAEVARPRSRPKWRLRIAELRKDGHEADPNGTRHIGPLTAPEVIAELWRITEGRAVVVTDVGQHQMWEAQHYHHERPRSLITSGGLGTMGFALPAAIGARFARRHDEIWVIAGDGGFQMTACELSTLAQEKLKINVAIINNGYLGMVRQWQELFYQGRYAATPISSPDFVKLAEAHGLMGLRVDKREDLAAVVERARQHDGSCVVDFRVAPEECVYPMVPSGGDIGAMIRRPYEAA
jgi:acetolactate synthase-1/2/3 large subunit